MYKLLSAVTGILIAVMVAFNGILASHMGNYTSTVIIHITGLICISLVLIGSRQKFKPDRSIKSYLYSAGAIGVFTVLFNNFSFNRLGASLTLAIGLLGQSVTSIVVDHFGLLGAKVVRLNRKKILGLVIICSGIVIMMLY